MSIPLPIRKGIRDNEVHLKENLEKINAAAGKDFEFEVDWGTAIGQLDQNSKERIGQLYQKDVMEYLCQNIVKLCSVEMSKEAFLEATSANKIAIRVNDKIKSYWNMSFENGVLVVEHKKNIGNLYEVGQFDLIKVMPTPGLPLATRLNLEQYKPNLDEALEKINSLTGDSDWTLEVDFDKIITQTEEHYKARLGELYYKDVMQYVVQNLEKTLKTETTKEAFLEATSQHKIIISISEKQQQYWIYKFNNGAIELTHKKSIGNLYEIGQFDLEAIIPSPGLPLVSRLNIEKHREYLESNLEKINNATGASDWSVEVDFEKVLPLLEAHYQKSVGELYYRSALEGIAQNIERTLKAETVKEAFLEATSQHKIVFNVNDKQSSYWAYKFENGAILVTHKKSIGNLYELGQINLVDLIPSPGLPLSTRIDIEKHRENLEEYLDRIRTATGESDWAVECDFEKAIKENPSYTKNIGEYYYKNVMDYLAQNIERVCKNETIKEAFLEATSQRKFILRVSTNPKEAKYWNLFFENGALIIQHKKDFGNLYEVGQADLAAVMPVPGVLTLLARLNIQDNQEKLQQHLEVIKEATGEEYTLDDSNLETLYKGVDEYYKNRLGETLFHSAMEYLASNLKNRLKDEMVKEAFNETATAHQIQFRPDPKQQSYWAIKFENGVVVVTFKPNMGNLYELGQFDIEKLL
jgi:hypothetical protein